jgi:hypothetical protein
MHFPSLHIIKQIVRFIKQIAADGMTFKDSPLHRFKIPPRKVTSSKVKSLRALDVRAHQDAKWVIVDHILR